MDVTDLKLLVMALILMVLYGRTGREVGKVIGKIVLPLAMAVLGTVAIIFLTATLIDHSAGVYLGGYI